MKQENIGVGINQNIRQFKLNEEKTIWLKDYIAKF